MKKIFVALSMVAFLVACDDSSSASAENSEPAALSSAEKQGSSSSVKSGSDEPNLSSSFEKKTESSSSEKLSDTSSSSADKVEPSSSENSSSSAMETITSSDGSVYDSSNTLTDLRDGQTYKTVKIGDQVWMAENLNYAYTGVLFDNNGKTSDSTSWCYKNDPANCAKYGRLYTWAAAMDSVGEWGTSGKGCGYGKKCSPTSPVRGICPKGWHLPSNDEWNALFTAVGGSFTAGSKLKSQTGWAAYSGITNEDAFGFSALPAGSRDIIGGYYGEGLRAYFWGSAENDSKLACYMILGYNGDDANLYGDFKIDGFSVRCLKD